MNKFSELSQERLETCHPDLQVLFNDVLELFDCSIICGYRNEQDQNLAYPKFSKVKYPDSRHNSYPSMAVDVIPWPNNWDDTKRLYFFGGFVLARAEELRKQNKITHKVRWGGDWDRDTEVDDQKFIDLPHFELISMEEA